MAERDRQERARGEHREHEQRAEHREHVLAPNPQVRQHEKRGEAVAEDVGEVARLVKLVLGRERLRLEAAHAMNGPAEHHPERGVIGPSGAQ